VDILEIKKLFETKFSNHIYNLSQISLDDNNDTILCKYKNKFLDFDKIAKEYHASWPTSDMIFFDLEREYIVFVEYKNKKMDTKERPKIREKFLDSLALLDKILKIEKETFWNLKKYMIFVTDRNKNQGQVQIRQNILYTDELLDILESDIIMFNFQRYKPWYFDEIKTPFCDEFAELMEKEFKIKLEEDDEQQQLNI
jgi:hypothetical protein